MGFNAFSNLQEPWLPADNGWQAAAGPVDAFVGASNIMTAGTLYLTRLPVRGGQLSLSQLAWAVAVAGTGASSGTFAGLYTYAAAAQLLQGSADIAAALLAGAPFLGLPAPVLTPSGAAYVYAGLLANLATTQPTIFRAGGVGAVTALNANSSPPRFATGGTGLVALPASCAPVTTNAFSFFAAAA